MTTKQEIAELKKEIAEIKSRVDTHGRNLSDLYHNNDLLKSWAEETTIKIVELTPDKFPRIDTRNTSECNNFQMKQKHQDILFACVLFVPFVVVLIFIAFVLKYVSVDKVVYKLQENVKPKPTWFIDTIRQPINPDTMRYYLFPELTGTLSAVIETLNDSIAVRRILMPSNKPPKFKPFIKNEKNSRNGRATGIPIY